MRFEFDSQKSKSNLNKHGIDFIKGQKLWENPVLEFRSINDTELRYLVIGKIGERFWTAIITYRLEAIRIISMRRARYEEKEKYSAYYGE